jgi:GDPmannose 4,6-dehydratase
MSSVHSSLSAGSRRRAIVIGAHGQDGRLLCTELEKHHYEVTRVGRTGVRTGDAPTLSFDIRDAAAVEQLVESIAPDEVYYLAAHHHSSEEGTGEIASLLVESFTIHCLCLVHILDAMQRRCSTTRLFYASSSLVFGHPDEAPQNETTPLRPVCVYGTTKAAGMTICDIYRREHEIFCCSGILFNHESPFRSQQFVTKKIVSGAVDIYLGLQRELIIGSLSAQADWGAAVDYVQAMRAVLSLPRPDNFVVATGKLHSVGDFARTAFSALGMDYEKHVREKPSLVQRPIRKVPLVGNPTKLTVSTGWSPRIGFEAMIQDMVQNELTARHQTK